MGFVVYHMEKAAGNDSGTTAHIERSIMPKNADPTRTYLNRQLIEYPEGVKDRTAAIQYRLDNAGLTRKIGSNQVQAIRILLSATPEDMARIDKEGKLCEWCGDSLRYLYDTFGEENIVSAHLHMDEKTPHIHATLVPIVKGERKRRKREEQVKKRYRKKPTDTVRLSADDIMTRQKLKSYQDGYAMAMQGYGLQRGINGSEARHISNQQYYREMQLLTDELRVDVQELQEQKETAKDELKRMRKEAKAEKLKGAFATTATNFTESVGSLFGGNKFKQLERENTALRQDLATSGETIGLLQGKVQAMEADHNRQLLEIQRQHLQEKTDTETQHKAEVSRLNALLIKAADWFPLFRSMLRVEKQCLAVGFTKEQTARLMTGKPMEYSGELYSDEHKRSFKADDVTAQVGRLDGKLTLAINGTSLGEWFKEQFERLRENIGWKPIQKTNRGFKL